MARKFLTSIDLNLSELQNAVIQNLAANPTTGNTDGRIYYNTVADELRVYANGGWEAVGSGDINNVVGTANEVDVVVAGGTATVSLPTTINANTTGNASTASALQTARTIALSGDVSGSVSFDGSASVSINTTIAANSVALGTDTTGNYVQGISGTTNQISASGSGVESANVTLSFPSAVIFPGTVTLNADPENALEAATKQYVDTVAEGLNVHPSVNVATTASVGDFNNPPASIDGVTLTDGMRVLVKNQGTTSENGIYVYNASTTDLVRASDYNTAAEIDPGDFFFVTQGNTYKDTGWVQTATVVTIGVSPILFTQFAGVGTYAAGAGLNLIDNVFSVDYAAVETQLVLDSFTKKATASIGNASATTFTVTHNFNTRDVQVQVYDNTTYDTVECDVVRNGVNTVQVSFTSAPALNAYRVVVIG